MSTRIAEGIISVLVSILLIFVTVKFKNYILPIEDHNQFAKNHEIKRENEAIYFSVSDSISGKTITIVDSTPYIDKRTWRYKNVIDTQSKAFTIPDKIINLDSANGKTYVVNLLQERANVARYDTIISFYVPPASTHILSVAALPVNPNSRKVIDLGSPDFHPQPVLVNDSITFSDNAPDVLVSTWYIGNSIIKGKNIKYVFNKPGNYSIKLERESINKDIEIRSSVFNVVVRKRKINDNEAEILKAFLENCLTTGKFANKKGTYENILSNIFHNNVNVNCNLYKNRTPAGTRLYKDFATDLANSYDEKNKRINNIDYVIVNRENGKIVSLNIYYE